MKKLQNNKSREAAVAANDAFCSFVVIKLEKQLFLIDFNSRSFSKDEAGRDQL